MKKNICEYVGIEDKKDVFQAVKKQLAIIGLAGVLSCSVNAEEVVFTSSDVIEVPDSAFYQSEKGEAAARDEEESLFTSEDTEKSSEDVEKSSEDAEEASEDAEESSEDAEKSQENLGQQIVDFAMQYVGNPYVWGGISLTDGADCSGFVLSVFAEYGFELPHFAASQAGYGTEVSMDELEPGDLVFYGYGDISHVAIYKGNHEIVHAQNEEAGICVTPVDFEPVICCRRLAEE